MVTYKIFSDLPSPTPPPRTPIFFSPFSGPKRENSQIHAASRLKAKYVVLRSICDQKPTYHNTGFPITKLKPKFQERNDSGANNFVLQRYPPYSGVFSGVFFRGFFSGVFSGVFSEVRHPHHPWAPLCSRTTVNQSWFVPHPLWNPPQRPPQRPGLRVFQRGFVSSTRP